MRCTVVAGPFAETLQAFDQPVSVAVLDCDLYESYATALRCLWPLLSPGGVIVLDEFGRPEKWPGAKRATDEFAEAHGLVVVEAAWFVWPAAPRWFLRKSS